MIKVNKQKLIPLSRLTQEERAEMDTVKYDNRFNDDRKALDILYLAKNYWDGLRQFRKDRRRNKNFNYGKQWGDMVTVDGKTMTEEEYIVQQGGTPLKSNLIRRLVRNVLGVYRSQTKEPTCVARDRDEQILGETMSTILQYNWQLNDMQEINARSYEDFLIGGLVVHKKTFGWRNGKCDCWTDYVNPDNFFLDSKVTDFRSWDVQLLGEIHDYSFEDVCREFARSADDYATLRHIYGQARNAKYYGVDSSYTFGEKRESGLDFFVPKDHNMCRVIEIWNKEMKPRYRCHDYLTGEYYKIEIEDLPDIKAENESRIEQGLESGMAEDDIPTIKTEWFMDDYWYYRFLTPLGHILQEGETPYKHGSHPYVYKAYPLIDGEIHSFVGDVVDQQKYVNRLITLNDQIIRSSAKGVVLFPEESKPEGVTWRELQETWARADGFIVYNGRSGSAPAQLATNNTNVGIQELLSIQLKFFEDISGVSGALQGKPGYSGMSGTLYAQQTQNATTSLVDLLETFSSFVVQCAYKDVKNIQQFYDTKRVVNIAGKAGGAVTYDPEKINNIEFDLSVVESTQTPVIRQMANEFLMQIWQAGQISLEQLLETGDFPFADNLLQQLKAQGQAMAQGQQPQQLTPDLQQQLQQAQQQANPVAVQQMQAAMQGA